MYMNQNFIILGNVLIGIPSFVCLHTCSVHIILLRSSSTRSKKGVSDNEPCQQTGDKMAAGNHCWMLYHNIHKKCDVDKIDSSVIHISHETKSVVANQCPRFKVVRLQ